MQAKSILTHQNLSIFNSYFQKVSPVKSILQCELKVIRDGPSCTNRGGDWFQESRTQAKYNWPSASFCLNLEATIKSIPGNYKCFGIMWKESCSQVFIPLQITASQFINDICAVNLDVWASSLCPYTPFSQEQFLLTFSAATNWEQSVSASHG